jgi:hypothetical protein
MLTAHLYKEERDADKIAYAVSLAWGGKRRRSAQSAADAKSDKEHLRALMRGESDGTPIQLTPEAVETIFAGDIVAGDRPYVPPPSTLPGVDIAADKAYLLEADRVFDELKAKKLKEN